MTSGYLNIFSDVGIIDNNNVVRLAIKRRTAFKALYFNLIVRVASRGEAF